VRAPPGLEVLTGADERVNLVPYMTHPARPGQSRTSSASDKSNAKPNSTRHGPHRNGNQQQRQHQRRRPSMAVGGRFISIPDLRRACRYGFCPTCKDDLPEDRRDAFRIKLEGVSDMIVAFCSEDCYERYGFKAGMGRRGGAWE
jgi:hypothetical protein